jgi:hypothetical protein
MGDSSDRLKPLEKALLAVALRDDKCYPTSSFGSDLASLRHKQNLDGRVKTREWDDKLLLWLEWYERRNEVSLDGKYEIISRLLGGDLDAETLSMASMYFSPQSMIRMIRIMVQINLKMFPIIRGETGVGKTMTINFLGCLARRLANWEYKVIDFHGAVGQDDVKEMLLRWRSEAQNRKTLILLDELNTSPACSFVVNHVLNLHCSGNGTLHFVAAINGVIEVDELSRQLGRTGIRQKIPKRISTVRLLGKRNKEDAKLVEEEDRSRYAYHVLKLPSSADSMIFDIEPDNSTAEVEFFGPE